MNYEIRPIAGKVRRHLDLELRSLRSRDVWAYATAVWPLLDRVLARWVAFVTPEMPTPDGKDTILRATIRECVRRARRQRDVPEYEFDSHELYVAILATFVGYAPKLARVQATLKDGAIWTATDGPLGLRTRMSLPVSFVWHAEPVQPVEKVAASIIDCISDDLTRPLTAALMDRIRRSA